MNLWTGLIVQMLILTSVARSYLLKWNWLHLHDADINDSLYFIDIDKIEFTTWNSPYDDSVRNRK